MNCHQVLNLISLRALIEFTFGGKDNRKPILSQCFYSVYVFATTAFPGMNGMGSGSTGNHYGSQVKDNKV